MLMQSHTVCGGKQKQARSVAEVQYGEKWRGCKFEGGRTSFLPPFVVTFFSFLFLK